MSISEPPAAVYLDFARNVFTNTTLSRRGMEDAPVYAISSTGLSTTLRHASEPEDAAPLATVKRSNTFLPDKITFRGDKQKKLSAWLKPVKALSLLPATMEENGTTYTWKLNGEKMLSLWSGTTQLAWYQPATRQMVEGKSVLKAACIALHEETLPIQDAIVVGFVVLGQKLRWDKNGHNVVGTNMTLAAYALGLQ